MAKRSLFALNILEEKNIIDDHLLDIFGNAFKFDHEKGLSEWLKNSVDAYRRIDVPDNEQRIIFRFFDGIKDDASLECIDFVGMNENDIVKAFKIWGDPEAARRGRGIKVYGGHGNGGKFYMRQMFTCSHFITYRDGYLNIFGFSEKKKYGFAGGYKGKKITSMEALKIANIGKLSLSPSIKDKIFSGKTGFTIVRGIGPLGMKNKIKTEKIIEKFKNHPQSRNILSRINVSIIYNNKQIYDLLRPEEIKPLDGFEVPRIISIPEKINIQKEREKEEVILANQKYQAGRLILKTSEAAFERNSRFEDLNRIDFIGEIGVIASHRIPELGVRNFPQASFIYGECGCPILEDSENYSIQNDRTKLVENERTRALLQWVSEEIDKLAIEITLKEQKEEEKIKAEISSTYNEFLNKWKNKFFKKMLLEVFGKRIENNGGQDRERIKKILETPKDLEFSFSFTRIPVNEKWPLTIKVRVPKPIPIGSVIFLSSNNPFIELENNEIIIKSDYVKKSIDGEKVAVINGHVVGRRVGEAGKVKAEAGKYSAEIEIEVVENMGGGTSRKPLYPKVLLSGIDQDPLNIAPGGKIILDPRQPLVYQRPQDTKEGIYWINTSAPLAQMILRLYDSHSLRWRDYLFQRYVEIFVKEAIYELQKKDPESFRAERIDSDILGTLISKIHSTAAEDLNAFLFKEDYEPPTEKETNI